MPNNFYGTEPQPAMPEQAPQVQNAAPTPNEAPITEASTGQLVVSVFTANQLYPVVGANVSITAENSDEILSSGTTDRSGRTALFTLPAPSAAMSQEPTATAPFTEYRVSITHPDYFEAVIENVQLFGSIITQLPVNLVPLPELNDNEAAKIVIIPRQNL